MPSTDPIASQVPALRVRSVGEGEIHEEGDYVLYWMIANRRPTFNFSLQRAVDWASALGKPLVILEALRCDYRWASDRIHWFIVQGMVDNARWFAKKRVVYHPYLEAKPGAGKGLLAMLASRACLVVSDDFPCFFLPRMTAAAAAQIRVRFELIDSNGLLPMRATERVFLRAVDFRRFLQKNLRDHLLELPAKDPLAGRRLRQLPDLPAMITDRWPAADLASVSQESLVDFPIDHRVAVAPFAGGRKMAAYRLNEFLASRLSEYGQARNHPHQEATSGLSPYLHFGHISAHELFARIVEREDWSPARLSEKANGSSRGWWGMSEASEGFLDQCVTWRELGYNMCSRRSDFDRYESLPDWAQETLAAHASDPREHVYSLADFEAARTHDPLWNAAQIQLIREGRIHNYMRMLWGKKILEWSATAAEALAVMIELNNKYALDGRNPNSYSGIFWVLGRYDRPWGPERPIYGKIRYMSSQNTARKFKVDSFLEKYAPEPHGSPT